MLGIVGRKAGMTRVFTDDGQSVPVTVIEAQPNRIVEIKTSESHGYSALKLAIGEQKSKRLSKAANAIFAKANVDPARFVCELRLSEDPQINEEINEPTPEPAPEQEAAPEASTEEAAAAETEESSEALATEEVASEDATETKAPATDIRVGGSLSVGQFEAGQKVDVCGVTIGKGFAGVVKRHNFAMQDATHGNSLAHRAPGSIGQCQDPGRVFKGKKMAGHMGNVKRTQQNLEVVRVDSAQNLILIKGAVPGAKGGDVMIRPARKIKNKQKNKS